MIRKSFHTNLFFIVFTIWYSFEIIFSTTLESFLFLPISLVEIFVTGIVSILLMVLIFFNSYKKTELISILFFTFPIGISAINSGVYTLLSAWLFIVAAKKIEFDRIIKTAYAILIIVIPVVILLYFVGIIENVVILRNGLERMSLGFEHPNQLGERIFQLALCHIYLRRYSLNIKDYFFLFLLIVFIIMVPNSQTAFICLVLLAAASFIYIVWNNRGKKNLLFLTRTMIVGSIVLNAMSIFLSTIDLRRREIYVVINKFLSHRFSHCHQVLNYYGVSLLGQEIHIGEQSLFEKMLLDNAYMGILLRFGIIMFVLFSFVYIWGMRELIRRGQYIITIFMFLYAIYGVMENGIYMLTHNIFLLVFSTLLYKCKFNET